MMKVILKGLATILMLAAVAMPAQSAFFGAVDDHVLLANSGLTGVEPVVRVQSAGQGQLVPPSVAGRSAMRYSGGKVLRIRLRKGARPVYVVKVKTGGQVHLFMVDAKNGRVIGRQ